MATSNNGASASNSNSANNGNGASTNGQNSRKPVPVPPKFPQNNGQSPDESPKTSPESPDSSAKRGFSVSGLAIRRPIGTAMIWVSLVVLGGFFLTRLNVDLLPAITYPRISVRVLAPGVGPTVAVEEITRPLEQALAATEGAVQVYSQTREGQVSIDLFFNPGADVDQALNDATASVNRARGQLPDNIEQPIIAKQDPAQLPVIEYALVSPSLSGRELRIFADEELARELAVVEGVAAVDVSGGAREEVQVDVDLPRLQGLGVGLVDVLSALAAENQDVSGGRLEGAGSESLTRTVGRFRSALEIEELSFAPARAATIPVPGTNASVPNRVFLRDFARVTDGVEDERVVVTLNRQPAVKVSVQKQPEANTIDVVEGVKARIKTLARNGAIPPGTELVATLDEAVFIRSSINDVAVSGAVGAGLAAAAILLFLGSIRQTAIIVLAIPLGTLFSVLLMGMFGLSLNLFSLGGLAIGIGAVDSCIVVLENIVSGRDARRRRNESNSDTPSSRASESETQNNGVEGGENGASKPASFAGEGSSDGGMVALAEEKAGELESALVASTTTNLIVVVPFLLIGGFVSLLFNELILTVAFSVFAALLTALTIVPMMASRLLAIQRESGLSRFFLVTLFGKGFDWISDGYRKTLSGAIRARIVVLLCVFGGLGAVMAMLLPRIPTEIVPKVSNGQARLIAQFPPGQPLETSLKIMRACDDIFLADKATDAVFTTTGGFLFGNLTIENPLRGSATISLKGGTDVDAYVSRMNRKLTDLNLVGIRLRMAAGEIRGLITSNSPIRGGEIDVVLQGTNEASLQSAGRQVLAILDEKAQLAKYRPNADPTQPEVQIRRNRARAGELGLSTQQIGETVSTAIEGAIPTQIQRGERLVDVRVRVARSRARDTASLAALPLFTQGNRSVRLSDVAEIRPGTAPGDVQRINQRNVYLIAGNLSQGAALGSALKESAQILKDVKLPAGVSLVPSAAQQSANDLQRNILLLGGLAIFLVFIVMAVQYDSLVDPLVILFTVPLALAGGVIGLFFTKIAIGVTVFIGVVLLIGIIVGNGIILVELANQIRDETGESRADAIAKAAPTRLRPIVMTTMIATLGLLPLAMGIGEGTALLRPLGVVTFFGLLLGTVLTLFVVPCLYVTLHDVLRSPFQHKDEPRGDADKPAEPMTVTTNAGDSQTNGTGKQTMSPFPTNKEPAAKTNERTGETTRR